MATHTEQVLAALPAAALRLKYPRNQTKLSTYPTVIDLAETDDRRWQSPPHIQLLNQKLVDLAQRNIKRLIVEMPPRHGKSFMCSKYFPAWYLSQFPHHNVIHASYEANFATLWGRRVRDLVSRHGQSLNLRLREDSSAAGSWETTDGGGMFCTGVGGPMTGRGANVLIIDDPVKNRDESESVTYRERTWEWWQSTAYPRLEPDAVAIVIMTRWHSDDLVGKLLADNEDEDLDDEKWTVLSLPAIAEEDEEDTNRKAGEALWPERYDLKRLERLRSRIGSYWWASLYQQRPSPREGALWKHAWIDENRVTDAQLPNMQRIVVAIDPAGSTRQHSDSTGITVAGWGVDNHYYVLVAGGYKESPDGWARKAVSLYDGWRADRIVGEGNYGGEMVEGTLRNVRSGIPFTLVKASRGKVLRAEPIAAAYEQGRVHHRGRLSELEQQLTSFPVSNEHDDILDSTVWALTELMEGAGEFGDGGFEGGY